MLAAIQKPFTASTRLRGELRAQVESEGVLYLADRVVVVSRFSGSVPGLRSGMKISRSAGALAFTRQRVIATLGSGSEPSQRVVDCRWDATVAGPLKVKTTDSGVQINLDIARVDPGFRGHLALHYKAELSDDVLAFLPRTSVKQSITAENVSLILGVRPKK